MAIDAETGAMQGTVALRKRAMKMVATKDEVVEAILAAYSIGDNRALFTSALVLQALFKQK